MAVNVVVVALTYANLLKDKKLDDALLSHGNYHTSIDNLLFHS